MWEAQGGCKRRKRRVLSQSPGEGPGSAAEDVPGMSPAAAQTGCSEGCSLHPTSSHGPRAGGPQLPPQYPPCCFWGWGKKPKPPAARGLGSGRQRAAAPPARRCSSTFLGCTAGAGWGRAERRLLAAVRALPWTGADLLLQNINKRLQEREGNLARNLCRSWLVIEE